jgi:hypothetical protein
MKMTMKNIARIMRYDMLVKRTETALFAYAVPPLSELPENNP